MSLDLNTFKYNLGNIVRPNRFLVEIQPPPMVVLSDYTTVDRLRMHVQSASIPDRSFNEISVKFYGMEMKLPGSEVIQDLSITFINDEAWGIRELFEAWSTAINDRRTSKKGNMEDLFTGSYIVVMQMDSQGNAIASYIYRHIFPKTVDQIELNMETADTIETFNVTFGYSYWEKVISHG